VRAFRRLPRALGDLVDACLEPDAAARPSTAELFAGLEELAEPGPQAA
jgi:hypothetical protein